MSELDGHLEVIRSYFAMLTCLFGIGMSGTALGINEYGNVCATCGNARSQLSCNMRQRFRRLTGISGYVIRLK